MAQLRQDHQQFLERQTVVIVIGPEGRQGFADYFSKHHLPFIGIPDPKHSVLKRYGQEVNLFKLGRMPAQVLVDKEGVARFVHYGRQMFDIPSTEEMLTLIDRINENEEMHTFQPA